MVIRRIILFFGVVLLFSQAALASDYVPFEYVIVKGDSVSKVALKLTNSLNYKRDGIVVVTKTGQVRPQAKIDHIEPGWKIQFNPIFITTKQVTESKGKTLAQVCAGSSDPRCVRKVAKLNSITRRQINNPLTGNVYALPGMVTALAVSNPVSVPVPIVVKTETTQTTHVPVAPASSAGPIPIPPIIGPRHPPSSSLPPASSSSDPPTAFIYAIGVLAIIGIFILGIDWNLYIKKVRSDSALQTRLADIRLNQLRETKTCIQEFVSKFETFFKRYLNPNANTVEILPEYLPWNGRGVIRIVPRKGGYPNLTNHKVDLDCDLAKFNATFPEESFRFEEPFIDDKPGVCVPFVHAGGEL